MVGSGIHPQANGPLYVCVERTQNIMTLDGWTYRNFLPRKYVITDQLLGGVVDTRLPDGREDLPRDADLPNPFLVYRAFGDGPAKKFGTVFGNPGVGKAESLPMELPGA